ncbi:MAG TPA: hypothetical protein VIO11_09370 [Candidatus Methanoperedens sp.]
MDIENFLILFLLSVTIPILYIKLVSGFVVSIIDRLINANFELNLNKFINLVIGYGIGSLLFSYIFYQFFKYGVISTNEISNASITMPFLTLTFCYFARVITRRNGRFSGRIYINGVTAIASLIFLVNTAIGLKSLGETPSGLFTQIIVIAGGLESNLITRIESSLEFLKSWIPTIALGSVLMATFGELAVVHLMKPNIRSLPAVLEKFPSDFSVITGNNQIENRMKEMTSRGDILSVKCITNTYKAFDTIQSNLETQWRILSGKGILPDYRIIGSSEQEIREYLSTKEMPNFGYIIRKIHQKFGQVSFNNLTGEEKDVKNRMIKLREMCDEGRIKHIETSFGRFRMLLVNDNEVMFTVLGGKNEKIGLYTKEKYILYLCSKLFDYTWERNMNERDKKAN